MGTQEKLLTDKITKQIGDSQKTIQEKITAQEKSVKDVSDKIGKTALYPLIYIKDNFLAKLEKSDAGNSSKAGGETAKLATLTKAIDSIQENSKSLESMGNYNLISTNVNIYWIYLQ